MKNRSALLILLAFCLLLSLLPVSGGLAAPHTEYVRNPTGRTVNVRRGPGKTYIVDYELKPGTKVTVESIEGAWTLISSPVSGWMMSKYLTDTPPASGGGGVVPSTMTRYITSPNGKKVNLRTGPDEKNYAVAAQVEPGTEVALLSTKNGWSTVSYNGFTLFVKSMYLTSYKPGTGPAPGGFTPFEAKVYSPNGKKVNMRVSPDLKADRIAQLEPWTHITVVGESGGWYRISWAASTGYMMKEFVRK